MAPSPSTAIKENRGSPWVGARGFCSLLRYLPGEEAAIGHIHAEGAQRGGDQDGQHRHCQHQLTAGEAHGKGHRANGGLYGGLWRVGDHGEEPLPEGESGTQETDEDPGHTEDQRPQDDGQSGGARAVETLSGGELFLASLSLAFGLSSVVQGSSGSVRLDSIFIDEGFGSLDQETLDTAMRALGQVQGAGRMVGIISHVSELKSRIVNQICVSRTPSGSSTLSVSGVGG